MGSLKIVVGDPVGASVVEIEEQGLVEQLVTHPAVKVFSETVLHRLAGSNKVPVDGDVLAPASIALQVNSAPWSDTIIPRLRCRSTIAVSSRATRRAEIDVFGMAPRFRGHVIGDVENAKTPAHGELAVNGIQRPACIWLGLNKDRGAGPYSFAASPSSRTVSPSSR